MKAILGAAVIALAASWVYAPSVRGGWLWDDSLEVTANASLRDPAGWWTPWVHPEGMDYFPLKSSLQWAEWQLWGANPLGYRAVNLALHAASALLVWWLLLSLGVEWAFVGGLLFAVHPIAVESVAWVSEFKNTSSLPFLLLACIAFLGFDRTGSRRAWVLSILCFVAALACKTSVVMLPFVLLLHAWWRRGRIARRDLAAASPFFSAALLLGAATVWFQSHRSIGIAGTPEGLVGRLGQAGWSLLCYGWDCVWPAGLEPVYPRAHPGPLLLLPWIAVAAALGLFWAKRAGWGRHALLGSGWFLLNLAPVLGLIPMAYYRVSPRADHFAYLPLVGIVGLAAAALGACARRTPRAVATGAAAVASLALACAAHGYAKSFASEKALWGVAAARNPGSFLARNNLGKVLYQEGSLEAAAVQFEAAVALEPDSPEAHANFGNCLGDEGRTGEARREYAAALAINPRFAGAHYDLGLLLLKAGRPASAEAEFRAAIESDPRHAGARNSLGLARAGQGDLDGAAAQYRLALGIDPGMPEAHLNLGNVYYRQGRLEEAVAEYRRALESEPRYSGAHHNLGVALIGLGRTAEGEAELSAAKKGPAR